MDWTTGMTAAAAGLQAAYNVGSGLFSTRQQRKAYSHYREDIKIGREREDTAMQRRVADLKAAGLNPMLAAGGSGAAATTPGQGEAPHHSGADVLGVIAQREQISMSRAERERIQAQIDNIKVDDDLKRSQIALNEANTGMQTEQHDYFRGIRGTRQEMEERRNRLEQQLEPTHIKTEQQRLANMVAEHGYTEMRTVLTETQRDIARVEHEIIRAGVAEAELNQLKAQIERYVIETIYGREDYAGKIATDLNVQLLTNMLTHEMLSLQLDRAKRDQEIEKELGLRTGEARTHETTGGGYIGIPGFIRLNFGTRGRY